MSKSIIKSTSTSFESVKANVKAYVESLGNYEQIKDQLPASNLTLVEDLMAGFGSYMVQKQNAKRAETYLSEAGLPSSVYEISSTFGYSINRYLAPSIKIKYNDVPTITLKSGDVLGTYKDYDIVYFGANKVIEKLDTIDVFIGTYVDSEQLVAYTDGSFTLDVIPTELASVDRERVRCFLNDVEQEISENIEDYVVYNQVADFSLSPFATRLFVSDRDNEYGVVAGEGAPFRVEYIETDGKVDNINLNDVTLNEEYLTVEVNSTGSDGDSLEKIKRLAPLLYSTLRRMVTEKDHSYLAEAYPLISSAAAERDLGTPQSDSFELVGDFENDTFDIILQGATYSYTGDTGDTKSTATQALYDVIVAADNPLVRVSIDTDNDLIIVESDDSRNTDYEVDGNNVTISVINENVTPSCCTVYIYYVLGTTTSSPNTLTSFEKVAFSNYLNQYKMVGLRLVLSPADVANYDLDINIQLTDSDYYDEVVDKINTEILVKTELLLNTGFDYGKFLTAVSNIVLLDDDGAEFKPVTAVVPNQTVYNIEPSKYEYIKFDPLTVTLV